MTKSFFSSCHRSGNVCLRSIVSVVLITILPLLALGTPGPVTGVLGFCAGTASTLGNTTTGGTWTSGNTAVAAINASSGQVTGISAGTAVISYTASDGMATAIVTVYPLPAPIAGPSVICAGSTITLSTAPGGGYWRNRGTAAIATVSGTGIVTGVAAGVAAITYTSDYFAGGCSVTKMVTVYATVSTGTFSLLNGDNIITTIAGSGTPGYSGDGGMATDAQLNSPSDMLVDRSGNIYVAEEGRIRKIDTAGIITTIVGTGESSTSFDDLPATDASFSSPMHIAMDGVGNIYVAEYFGHLRIIDTSGMVSNITSISSANGMAIDPFGYICISAESSHRVTTRDAYGTVKFIAGNGLAGGYVEGIPATDAPLASPGALLTDPAGNIYICSSGGHRVSRVDPAGIIHSFAGNGTGTTETGVAATSTGLGPVTGMAMDAAGNFYLADGGPSRVFKIDPSGIITTYAGVDFWSTSAFGDGGPATAALLVSEDPCSRP